MNQVLSKSNKLLNDLLAVHKHPQCMKNLITLASLSLILLLAVSFTMLRVGNVFMPTNATQVNDTLKFAIKLKDKFKSSVAITQLLGTFA